MNIVKGLIIKDLLQLKSYKKTLIIFILIFAVTFLTQQNSENGGNMLIIMMTTGLGMFSIATFSYDEMAKANKYIVSLPVTKKQIVLSKYILVISSTILGSIIGIVLTLIFSLITKKTVASIEELLMSALGVIVGLGLIEGIYIPCIYKYGIEKGKIHVFIITAIVGILIGIITYISSKLNYSGLEIESVLQNIKQFVPIILIGVGLVIYSISYKISYRIYKRQDL